MQKTGSQYAREMLSLNDVLADYSHHLTKSLCGVALNDENLNRVNNFVLYSELVHNLVDQALEMELVPFQETEENTTALNSKTVQLRRATIAFFLRKAADEFAEQKTKLAATVANDDFDSDDFSDEAELLYRELNDILHN